MFIIQEIIENEIEIIHWNWKDDDSFTIDDFIERIQTYVEANSEFQLML